MAALSAIVWSSLPHTAHKVRNKSVIYFLLGNDVYLRAV